MVSVFLLALFDAAVLTDLAKADNRPSLWCLVFVAWAITCRLAGTLIVDLVAAACSAVARRLSRGRAER
jgi:hypothetical protein